MKIPMLIELKRKYPLCILGYNITRWESLDAPSTYFNGLRDKLLFWKDKSKQNLGPAHIQYTAKWGFLITWPFCFHFWYQFKPQVTGVPGSETVFYWRFGFARWDAGMKKYIVPTWYGPGLHWD